MSLSLSAHHSGVAGLLDDDHVQYLHIDGRRELSDTWDVGPWGVIVSQLWADETSNPPFVVASGTKVTGLNAEFLGGEADTYFGNVGILNAGNLAYGRLPNTGGIWTANPTISGTIITSEGALVSDTITLNGRFVVDTPDTVNPSPTTNVAGMTAILFKNSSLSETVDDLSGADTGQVLFIAQGNNHTQAFVTVLDFISVTLQPHDGVIIRYNGTGWTVLGSNTGITP